jgi:hypothetical protein
MSAPSGIVSRQRHSELPLDIYKSLVDALFDDRRSLFIGSVAASLAALISAWKSGHWLLLVFGLAIAIVAYARSLDMRAYGRIKLTLTDADSIRRWELRYVLGAAIYVALLGGWTFASFAVTSDPFIHLLSFSVSLAYMIGTSGRNFASKLLVLAQIVFAGVPLSASLFVAGGFYYVIFGLVLIPFYVSLKFISDRLRNTLLDAVIATRDVSQLAKRFDTALTNMPHGLCMFDSEGRL